jgi:hypothetical protein
LLTPVQLLGVTLLSILTLTITLALNCCHVLSPLLNLIINIILLLLWVVGLSLLGWNMSGTLGHVCNASNWGSDAGIMVCRLYKALFTFTLFGAISAIAMVTLDLKVRKKQTSLGKYNPMRDSGYSLKPVQEAFSSGALAGHHNEHPEPWQRAGHDSTSYGNRDASRERIRSDHFGYSSPLEQTTYDSGTYADRDRR